MLVSEIIYNIKNLMSGGVTSDDFNLSNEQILFIVNYYRAKLIKQDQDKGRYDKAIYTQNLGSVNITQADKNECCEGDCILRTEFKIPKPLETRLGLNITFVGTTNGSPFSLAEHNALFWNKAAKYTAKEPKWYYQNGYIYLVNPPTKMLKTINIQGIFENPEEANKFKTCSCPENNIDADCSENLDFEYNIPAQHIDTIIKLIASTELQLLRSFPSDIINDSVDQIAKASNGRSK
jgi:hypothetical protein